MDAEPVTSRLSPAQFDHVRTMVNTLTGIVVKEHKIEMIHSRLSRRLRALDLQDFGAYLDFVGSDAGQGELREMINAVTTNLTSFFRESHHFDHLRDEILRPMAENSARRLRVWSSACSTGEEPYSIVMTLRESPAAAIADKRILATDLDTNVLARAKDGMYTRERIVNTPSHLIEKNTDKIDADHVQFSAEPRKIITFKPLNLLDDWPMSGPFDAIFCRNVLIYFGPETKKSIVDRMALLLRPDGALYLGHSESLLGDHPLLISEGRTIYRRRP